MNHHNRSKKILVTGLVLSLIASCPQAFARDHHPPSHPRYEKVRAGHSQYHYRDGRFYRPGWFGFHLAINFPPVGAVITYLPSRHTKIFAGAETYYYYEDIYYKPCGAGYIVVPPPVIKQQVIVTSSAAHTSNSSQETVTVNIPNENGSFTPVTLIKNDAGYIGPQGEYYAGRPTIEQLKVLYGA